MEKIIEKWQGYTERWMRGLKKVLEKLNIPLDKCITLAQRLAGEKEGYFHARHVRAAITILKRFSVDHYRPTGEVVLKEKDSHNIYIWFRHCLHRLREGKTQCQGLCHQIIPGYSVLLTNNKLTARPA